jgi:hypothetical protein
MNPFASLNLRSFSANAVRALLLFALLLGSTGAVVHAQADAAAPEQVIRDFYKWYVGQLIAERDPFTDGRAELKRFASERLLRQLDKARNREGGIGSDPFLDAQDFDKDWAKNITVATPVVNGEKATAQVDLEGAEMGTQKLKLSLLQEKGSWKVDKVESR